MRTRTIIASEKPTFNDWAKFIKESIMKINYTKK